MQTSAAAFTKGLLDLEGSALTPILVRCGAVAHSTVGWLAWERVVLGWRRNACMLLTFLGMLHVAQARPLPPLPHRRAVW